MSNPLVSPQRAFDKGFLKGFFFKCRSNKGAKEKMTIRRRKSEFKSDIFVSS